MTNPLDPLLPAQASLTRTTSARASGDAWSREMARAQGEALRNQARGQMPQFAHTSVGVASSPSPTRAAAYAAPLQRGAAPAIAMQPGAQAAHAGEAGVLSSAKVTELHAPVGASVPVVPEWLAPVGAGVRVLSAATSVSQIEQPTQALAAALSELDADTGALSDGTLTVHAAFVPEGVELRLVVSGVRAQSLEDLCARVLAEASRAGLHVATLVANGQIVHQTTRGRDGFVCSAIERS